MNLAQALSAGRWTFPVEGTVALWSLSPDGAAIHLDMPPGALMSGMPPIAPTIRTHTLGDREPAQPAGPTLVMRLHGWLEANPGKTSHDMAAALNVDPKAVSTALSKMYGRCMVEREGKSDQMFTYRAVPKSAFPEGKQRGGGKRRGLLRLTVTKVLLAKTATRAELHMQCDARVRDGLDTLLARMMAMGEVTRERDEGQSSYAYTITDHGREVAKGFA